MKPITEERKAEIREYQKRYRAANREKLDAYMAQYRIDNADKIRAYVQSDKRKAASAEYSRRYREKYPERKKAQSLEWRTKYPDKYQQMQERLHERHVGGLTDGYVRRVLVFGTKIKPKDFPQEMIDAKRIEIQINREIKNAKRNGTA